VNFALTLPDHNWKNEAPFEAIRLILRALGPSVQ